MSSPVRILIVDDKLRFRTMLRRYLVGESFKVSDAVVRLA
jgi:DNA-binding response OmpR family regulator